MKLSVIIPTHNRSAILRTCLEKLMLQEGVDFEVIVVDDGSTDDTELVVTRHFKQVRYIKQPASQQGVARNNGAKEATGDILLFIGDDIFADPGFLMQHMDVHHQNSGEEVVCLGYTTWDPELDINPYMKFLEASGWQFAYKLLNRGFVKHPEPYKFFYTSNISLKKSLFLKEGFDTHFHEYGWEDIELGYRLWKNHAMHLYYEPDAKAWHHHEIPESSLKKRMQTVGRSAVLFEQLEPSVSVVPKGLKALVLYLVTLAPFVEISRIFGKNLYFKLKSWRYFLEGKRQAEILDKNR